MTRLGPLRDDSSGAPGFGAAGPRRVLFTDYYRFVGGGQQNLLSVFKAMDRKRYQPLLALPGEGEFSAAARALKVPVFVTPMAKARWRLPWQAYPAMRRLRLLMRVQQVSLVHANDFPSLKLAVVAAQGLGIPTLFHQQIAVTQKPGSSTGWLLKHHAGKADRILAVSQNSLEALAALGIPRERLRLLYNNADTVALAKAKPLSDRAMQAAGLPLTRPLILAAGMRRPHKGFDSLLQAAALHFGPLKRGRGAPCLALLGDVANAEEAHEAMLKALEAAPACQGNVFSLPAQRPLAPWLKRAALFVSSSRWEGSPLVVLEAMAAGCAVLATRQAAGEVIEHGRTGWLVDREDPQALAQAMGQLMGDAPLRRRLGKAAQEDCERRFSLSSYIDALQDHYDELCQAQP